LCCSTLALPKGSAGVPREFGGRSKRSEKKLRNKKLSKFITNIIFKNNTIIRILAIELLNTILLLVLLMIKSLLKKLMACVCRELKKVERLCSNEMKVSFCT
jgi:hypothetical protein